MINVRQEGARLDQVWRSVDKNKNILLIAPGRTDYKINEIMYFDSYDMVQYHYGESVLTEGFQTAQELGVPHIFVANVKSIVNLITMSGVLRQYDFTYIVPVGLKMSDSFQHLHRTGGPPTLYAHFILEVMQAYNRSMIIMTDEHASLYEDIDHFLNRMRQIESAAHSTRVDTGKLVFVLNHLADYPYANLVTAAAMVGRADGSEYPVLPAGRVLFSLDHHDIGRRSMVFFQENHNRAPTIENLVTLLPGQKPEKSLTTMAAIHQIHRSFNLDALAGRRFITNTANMIRRLMEEYLNSVTGTLIASYEIRDIRLVKENAGVGRVEIELLVKDIRTFEVCVVVLEV